MINSIENAFNFVAESSIRPKAICEFIMNTEHISKSKVSGLPNDRSVHHFGGQQNGCEGVGVKLRQSSGAKDFNVRPNGRLHIVQYHWTCLW